MVEDCKQFSSIDQLMSTTNDVVEKKVNLIDDVINRIIYTSINRYLMLNIKLSFEYCPNFTNCEDIQYYLEDEKYGIKNVWTIQTNMYDPNMIQMVMIKVSQRIYDKLKINWIWLTPNYVNVFLAPPHYNFGGGVNYGIY